MPTLSPRAIRMAAGVPEIYAARAAGVGRGLLRTYEANRECVKTPGKRWLLDEYYAGLERLLLACEERARALDEGRAPEEQPQPIAA